MVSGKTWMQIPLSIRVELKGGFKPRVSGKDLILHLLGIIGVDGANYQALEFTGPGVTKNGYGLPPLQSATWLSKEARNSDSFPPTKSH